MPAEELSVPIEASPTDRIAAAVDRFGERNVVERALTLLDGDDETQDFLLFMGGSHANGILNGAPALYWPELWGARAFMYIWDDSAAPAIRKGLDNRAWRVREMCAKVAEHRGLPFSDALAALLADEVPRVRSAAARALAQLGLAEHAEAISVLLRDGDVDVRRQAGAALKKLAVRTGTERDTPSHAQGASASAPSARKSGSRRHKPKR
ncbi:HEAT repeat domain-containing protein [Paenarthrobacter sp. Z7-10]|uniref:HEAT repeat domain-containing protein n=1 Tax=Paenarthrobacter sp. Z7-10 TaxID=2787635 RepID=UPI0022A94DD3|nr:HEAT repeat domain-containing protein [Paenarthrobacter sp. Z7-10]MCZ2402896.1 HEAT repeat domain-containing protein [Paenarthrobacter sp. Z7-10]